MTRTGLVARLFNHSPAAEVEVHANTLASLGLSDGMLVRVSSRRGSAVMRIRASEEMRPGDAFMAMHWGGRFTAGIGTNALTLPVTDPYSRQPELKHAAVRIEAFTAQWQARFSAPATPELQRAAAAWLARFDYAALSLVEGPETLLRLDLATSGKPDTKALAALQNLFGQSPQTGPAAFERSICACFRVGENEIRAAVARGASLAGLQQTLKCGTNCGSCMPELRRLASAAAPGAAA
jgi:assimilatory nitrate reductase catalytic subunit